jgi:predicted nucleic acid-binding protein
MRPYELTGRIVHPDYRAWLRVGASLVTLRNKFHVDIVKRRALANDLLIAFCAVQIGAIVVTNETADFRLLQKVTPLRWAGTVQDAIRL